MSTATAMSGSPNAASSQPPKRKRLLKIVIVFLVILILIGVAGPFFIASYAGSAIDSAVAEKIFGTSKVGSTSFSWPAKVGVSNWTIRDAQERPVVSIADAKVTVAAGALLSGRYEVALHAKNVEIVVHEDADGTLNTSKLPRPPKKSGGSGGGDSAPKPMDLDVDLDIADLKITLVAKDGSRSSFDQSSFKAHIVSADLPSTFEAILSGKSSGTAKVNGELKLYRGKILDVGAAEGFVAAAIDKLALANLRPLAGVFTPLERLSGTVDGSARYDLKSLTSINGQTKITVASLDAAGEALGKKPISFKSIVLDNQTTMNEAGTGSQKTTISVDDFAKVTSDANFTDIAKSAGSFTGNLKLDADVEGLTRAAGGLLRMKDGIKLAGKIAFGADLTGKTVDKSLGPTDVVANLKVDQLAGTDPKGRALPIDKTLTLKARGSHDPAGKIALPELLLTMGKLQVTASGGLDRVNRSMDESQIKIDADLSDLTSKLGSFIELPMKLGGAMTLNTKILAGKDTTRAQGKLGLTKFEVLEFTEKPIGPLDLSLDHAATLDLRPKGRTTIDTFALTSDMGTVGLTGTITDIFEASRDVRGLYTIDLDPKGLMKRLGAFFGDYAVAGSRLKGGGNLTMNPENLSWTLDIASGALDLSGGLLGQKGASLKDLSAKIESSTDANGNAILRPNVTLKDLAARDLSMGLESWNLKSGAINLTGEILTQKSGAMDVNLLTNLEQFDVASKSPLGKSVAVKDPKVGLNFIGGYDKTTGSLKIAKGDVSSSFLSGTVGGEMLNTKTEPTFKNFTGNFKYIPEKLGAVLSPWLPGKLTGAAEQKANFTLNGAAKSTKMLDILRSVDADATAGLSTLSIVGFGLGGDLKLAISGQKMTTNSALTASGGKLKLDGNVDLREDPSAKSNLKFGLEDGAASNEMSPLLQLLNPIFAVDGTGGLIQGLLDFDLNLDYNAPIPPAAFEDGGWDKLPKKPFNGKGRIAFSNLAVGGTTILGQLVGFLGLSGAEQMTLEPIDFTVKSGRVHYDKPLGMMIGSTQLTWTGSIGLDKTLDMALNVPISEGLVGKKPLLRSMLGKSIAIPVGGTTAAPKLDFEKALAGIAQTAITSTLEEKVGGKVGEKVEDALGGALGGILGGGSEKKASDLLKDADKAWDAGKQADAVKLYQKLKKDYPKTDAYKKNKERVDTRAK